MKVYVPVIESPVYSQILFSICKGKKYGNEISEYIGKTQATIQKQLTYLSKKGYVQKVEGSKDKNKKLFEINWDKLVEDFIKGLKEQRDTLETQDKAMQSNRQLLFGKRLEVIKFLDSKDFLDRIKKNEYLLDLLKGLFPILSKSKYTITDMFCYIFMYGNLGFAVETTPNLERVSYVLQTQDKGFFKGIHNEDISKINKKQFEELLKESRTQTENRLTTATKRAEDISHKDKALFDILLLDKIIKYLRAIGDLFLQSAINQETQRIAYNIIEKHFSEIDVKRYKQIAESIYPESLLTSKSGIESTKSTEHKGELKGKGNEIALKH